MEHWLQIRLHMGMDSLPQEPDTIQSQGQPIVCIQARGILQQQNYVSQLSKPHLKTMQHSSNDTNNHNTPYSFYVTYPGET